MRLFRVKNGLSQEQAAGRCGLDQATWSHYEAGERRPTVENAAKILRGAEIPIEWWVEPCTALG